MTQMILHEFFLCMDVDSNQIFSISQQSVAARLFGRKKKTENVNFHLRKQVCWSMVIGNSFS